MVRFSRVYLLNELLPYGTAKLESLLLARCFLRLIQRYNKLTTQLFCSRHHALNPPLTRRRLAQRPLDRHLLFPPAVPRL